MKNVMILIVLLFIGNALQAQDKEEQISDSYEKQIGVNVSGFFFTFLSFNNSSTNTTPLVLFLYKKNKDGKRKRFGLGGSVNWQKQPDQDVLFSSRVNINFGREFVRKIGKKWKTYVGYETILSGSYSEMKFENFDDEKVKDFSRSASIGWKGLVGLEFYLNDQLSLLTETSYGVSFNYSLDKFENSFVKRRENYSAGTFYVPPTSLILSYHF
jgi:hypothetical protein